ncbi:MAG: glycosyl hydrolase 53 family protein [Bacteroidales bacterium]|nr:glycosyl hydrolase 53 family protein [Bacteroidales bacterium]
MKHTLLITLVLVSLCACKTTTADVDPYIPAPVGSYAKGADCSWLTEQEQDNVLFYNAEGKAVEGMRLMRDYGMNSVRLRVFVNHKTGWCNKQDVLVKAKRAAALKLRVMIDFHYSDYFADPGKQNMPEAWKTCTIDQLCDSISSHTTEVLQMLQQAGVTPEWVQVGNETRNGMLWPIGQLWTSQGDTPNGWKNYARMTLTGYNAVKSIFPNAQVIVHIDNAYENNNWFFRKLKQNGGKFDMIGLSHYPMMYDWSKKYWPEMNELAEQNIKLLHGEFGCPVMLCEIGTLSANVPGAKQVMTDIRTRLDSLDYFAGIFYWEPQVYGGWKPAEYKQDGWEAYNMGAFTKDGQPNDALITLWK